MGHETEANHLSHPDVAEVMRIVEEATLCRRTERPKHRIWRWLDPITQGVRDHGLIGFVTMLLMAALGLLFGSRPLLDTSVTIGLLTSCLGLLLLFLIVVAMIPSMLSIAKEPRAIFMGVVKEYAELNLKYVNQLTKCDALAVRYVLLHYRAERVAFERRCAIFAGSLDKIGIFPALAAFVGLAFAILKAPNNMIQQLVYLVPAFYIISFAAYMQFQELDRVIAQLEFSLLGRA